MPIPCLSNRKVSIRLIDNLQWCQPKPPLFPRRRGRRRRAAAAGLAARPAQRCRQPDLRGLTNRSASPCKARKRPSGNCWSELVPRRFSLVHGRTLFMFAPGMCVDGELGCRRVVGAPRRRGSSATNGGGVALAGARRTTRGARRTTQMPSCGIRPLPRAAVVPALPRARLACVQAFAGVAADAGVHWNRVRTARSPQPAVRAKTSRDKGDARARFLCAQKRHD